MWLLAGNLKMQETTQPSGALPLHGQPLVTPQRHSQYIPRLLLPFCPDLQLFIPYVHLTSVATRRQASRCRRHTAIRHTQFAHAAISRTPVPVHHHPAAAPIPMSASQAVTQQPSFQFPRAVLCSGNRPVMPHAPRQSLQHSR